VNGGEKPVKKRKRKRKRTITDSVLLGKKKKKGRCRLCGGRALGRGKTRKLPSILLILVLHVGERKDVPKREE